jgi:hypothetical protein
MAPVEGCRWCDIPPREHAQRYVALFGWHGWVDPGNDMRAARKRAQLYARSPNLLKKLKQIREARAERDIQRALERVRQIYITRGRGIRD